MTTLTQLYKTLNERRRPEDVANMIVELLKDSLNTKERLVLDKAARGSLAKNIFGYTSMLQTFAEAKGAGKQIAKATEIFKLDAPNKSDYNSKADIEGFLNQVSPLIHKPVGQNDFKTDRLSKTQRKENGLTLSKRSYNKKWRMLTRLEKKLQKFIRETKKIEFQKISKHGLAHKLDEKTFSEDVNTACFIAYYNARCNLRSVFTTYSKKYFSVPANLYIVGTMNTADRSVEALDTALRRRFAFEEKMPEPKLLIENVSGIALQSLLAKINERIELLLDRDHTIGHSYFINVKDEVELKLAFKNKILPLLQEYFYGDYGKVGLVLGGGFVAENKPKNTAFAKFNYPGNEQFIQAKYELLSIDESFKIIDAVKTLLNETTV